MLHLVGCLYYLYQWCTVKQITDNGIYLLIKYIKSVLWNVEDALCLKVNNIVVILLGMLRPWRLRLQASPQRWWPFTTLHVIVYLKTEVIFIVKPTKYKLLVYNTSMLCSYLLVNTVSLYQINTDKYAFILLSHQFINTIRHPNMFQPLKCHLQGEYLLHSSSVKQNESLAARMNKSYSL